jgi:hypothetical protein
MSTEQETTTPELTTDEVVTAEAETQAMGFVDLKLTKKALRAGEYIPTIGRRKTATATVRLSIGKELKLILLFQFTENG